MQTKKFFSTVFSSILIVALMLVAMPAQTASAASFNVSTAAELIAAINTANTNGADDVINFTADITLTAVDNTDTVGPNGLPIILDDGSLTIEGNGFTLSRDSAAPAFRFFSIGADTAFTLNNLTLSNGLVGSTCNLSGTGECGGGALYVNSSAGLTTNITNSTFLGNKADENGGAVYTYKNLTISDSTFSGNIANNDNDTAGVGGGIYAGSGNLILSNTSFTNNSARSGGAIWGYYVYLNGATVSENTAVSGAGGVAITESGSIDKSLIANNTAAFGGGINYQGCCEVLTVTNTTISGNNSASLGGALFASNTDSIRFFNSTLSGNSAGSGGGINSDGTNLYLYNTVIANSTGGDCQIGSASITASNNMIEDTGANACGLTNGVNGNIIGSDPNLGPLADNGGPTQTHALLVGSPAIDAGNATTCSNAPVSNKDQRGVTRPQGAACDIGAYEYGPTQTSPNFIVNTNADTDDGFCDLPGQGTGNQDCTLREAINAANADTDASIITFADDYTITLASQLPDITTTMTITGNGAANTILQAAASPNTASYRVLRVYHSGLAISGNLTLNAVTVQNGRAPDGGGIFNDSGTLTINNSMIRDNYTNGTVGGGGVRSNGGALIVTNSTFEHNVVSEGNGGAIGTESTSVTVSNSTFTNNYALDGGGGIYVSGTLNLFNSTFSGNDTDYLGDGIYIRSGILNYANNIIANSPGNHCYLELSTLNTNINNLVEGGGCSAALSGDPNLGPLQDNGGSTETMALLSGSSAIDAGNATTCSNAPVSNKDQRGITRPQGAACDIGAYELIQGNQTFTSNGKKDGLILESSENSNTGGSKDKTSDLLYLGDDASNRQYRSILSFNTAGIPDGATLTSVTLMLNRAGSVGGDPLNAFGGFMVDIKHGNFGKSALQLSDFKKSASATAGPLTPDLITSGWFNGWYSIDLTSFGAQINLAGNTQIRLRLNLDDNNNSIINLLKLYSGNASADKRPQLIVEYSTP